VRLALGVLIVIVFTPGLVAFGAFLCYIWCAVATNFKKMREGVSK
jgi:hypothetical protein